jgi:predicted dehydrogenase
MVQDQYPSLKVTPHFEDLLGDCLDAVVIATPVGSHFELAREALLNNKHVLVEKPMTSAASEARELIEIARKRDLVLMVGHTYEYHPAVDYLRNLVGSGELGEIYSIDAARLNLGLFRPDANVLWDLAPHDICIALSLLGKDPVAVSARGAHHVAPSLCDVAYLELVFGTGTMCNIHVSWLHPRKVREITIVGSRKMAVYDDVSESEKIHIYDKGLALEGGEDDGFSAWPPSYRYGDVTIPFIPNAEPLKLECSHFVHSIVNGETPRSDGRAGLRVTAILEAADRSLANGGRREKLAPLDVIAETGAGTTS